ALAVAGGGRLLAHRPGDLGDRREAVERGVGFTLAVAPGEDAGDQRHRHAKRGQHQQRQVAADPPFADAVGVVLDCPQFPPTPPKATASRGYAGLMTPGLMDSSTKSQSVPFHMAVHPDNAGPFFYVLREAVRILFVDDDPILREFAVVNL